VSAQLYLKDPATSRFTAGGLAEAEELLGSPLPDLPAPERDNGREVFFVHVHSRLRILQQRFLEAQLGQIGALTVRSGDPARDYTEYESALQAVVQAVRSADRRQGLLNLFWLGHSLAAAEHLRALEARSQSLRRGKHSLFPLLQSFYRRIDQECRRPLEGEVVAGENASLVASIIDDGFAFGEMGISDLDLGRFLSSNKRYRIPSEAFFEIQQTLVAEAERRLRDGDRGLLARAARHLPLLPREHYLKPASLLKIVLNSHVLTYLLGDPWSTAPRLLSSPTLRGEAERRRGPEVLDAFIDLAVTLRRFEIVSYVRDRVVRLSASDHSPDLDEKTLQGLRVYEFGASAQVLNSAVTATVLFLDLRGFTRTSEGQISERDLTRELYAVFDDFVPIVERFGGNVDKYLGDGMMVTWGTDRADPLHPLSALRTAILCQESLRRKREEGRTWFKMGVAIHHGRVHLARFIAGKGEVQSTVIGRNVNLAGRLSSAAKRPIEEDDGAYGALVEALPVTGRGVSVDSEGTLFNEGIAISRDTLVQLETHLALIRGEGVIEYEDEAIDRRILIRYAGDAKFKGVQSSLPVYDVDCEARS
jgi:class 3 adenylate cyclase